MFEREEINAIIVRIVILSLLFTGPLTTIGCDRSESATVAEAIDAEAIDAALNAAESYRNSDDLPKAEAILARLIEKSPRDWRGHELMGRVLSQKAATAEGRGDAMAAAAIRHESYTHYETAVASNPDSPGLRQSAGVIAMMAGEQEAALGHFRRAAEIDPTDPQAPLYAAQILITRQDFSGAESTLLRVLAIDPDEPAAHASLAVVALQSGREEDARRHIGEARSIAPDDLRFRIQEAQIRRRTGDARRAVELLAGLPERDRAQFGVCSELAAAFTALDRHDSAAGAWGLVYRTNPNDPSASRFAARAGRAWLRGGDVERAAEWLDLARSQLNAGATGPSANDIDEVRELEEALLQSSPRRDG